MTCLDPCFRRDDAAEVNDEKLPTLDATLEPVSLKIKVLLL